MAATPNNAQNVSTGKAMYSGGVYCAPFGTQIPNDADTALDAAFENLGYVSEDGVTIATGMESDSVKAWGGDVVMNIETGGTETFQFTLIESLNTAVLKAVYGADNVTGSLDAGLHVKVGAMPHEPMTFVLGISMRGNVMRRIVVPYGVISEVGDIVYNDSDPVGYEVTVTAMRNGGDAAHHEYTKKKVVAG